jgi:lipoprotein-anchoring transpeptidase ErfK/SrfK
MRGNRRVALFGCTLAGVLLAVALAAPSAGQPPPPPPPPSSPAVDRLPARVTIGGVRVGRMRPYNAYRKVRASFTSPLVLVLGRYRLAVRPAKLGTRALVLRAVRAAAKAAPGTAVRLPIRIRGAAVRSYVKRLARRRDREAVDAGLVFRGIRPWATRERWGREVDRPHAARAIVRALARNRRDPIRLRFLAVRPGVTRRSLTSPAIVIQRESRVLRLYAGTRLWQTFGVAVGQSSYPTPLGLYEIAVMWRHPWWYPPDSDWARGSSPVPPGPGNPLGTRWMGLTAPGVGIHGTPDAASIGYSASHGCIRMHISSAEWLFNNVSIGTPVYIVAA